MKLCPITLSFKGPFKDLEKLFLDTYFKKYLSQSKILHLITILFYGSCIFIDLILFPDLKQNLLSIRGVTCAVFLLGFILSFTSVFAEIWQFLFAFYVILTGFSFITAIIITRPPFNLSYSAGVIVCMIFGYIFIRARFITSLISCWALFIFYEIAIIYWLDVQTKAVIVSSYYLGIVSILGTIISRSMEYNERKNFYQAYMLEKANNDLADQIKIGQRTEEKLAEALRYKEVYLREIHHRVKNNLQVISSLMDMTYSRSENPLLQKTLLGARAKIQAMASVHHQLYQNENVHKIDMGKQIQDLYNNLSMVYGTGVIVTAEIDAKGVYLNLDQAMPCALVINELISNALEHGFQGRTKGVIDIRMNRFDKKICLDVIDDGIGLPESLDMENISSLGLRLVKILVTKQLKGSIHVTNQDGAIIAIRFDVWEKTISDNQKNNDH